MEEPDQQTLQNLLEVATELNVVATSCPSGLRKTDQTLAKEKGLLPIPELLQTKQWLLKQIQQYECAVIAGR